MDLPQPRPERRVAALRGACDHRGGRPADGQPVPLQQLQGRGERPGVRPGAVLRAAAGGGGAYRALDRSAQDPARRTRLLRALGPGGLAVAAARPPRRGCVVSAPGWDPWQREALAALGHRLYVRAPRPGDVVPDDPLAHALLRAAGRDPGDPGAADLLRRLPPLASLRGDPAAKRALWPRLRALRRGDAGA